MKKIPYLLILALMFSQIVCAQYWQPLPGGSLNYFVTAIIKFKGHLWVGGAFSQAGPISAQYVVRHDGNNWIQTPALQNAPFHFCEYNSELYALGGFEVDGNRYGMMKWTGSSWQPLGAVDASWGRMETAVVYGGELIVGGQFYSVDGTPATSLAKWNGNFWTTFSGQTNCFWLWPPRIKGLHENNGILYVAGAFDELCGVNTSCAGKWNGSSWSNLSIAWNTHAKGFVSSGNNTYCYGIFQGAGSSTSWRVAKVDSINVWANTGNGIRLSAYSGANYNSKIYIAGEPASYGGDYIGNCGYWDGSQWVADNLGLASNSSIRTLYNDASQGVLYAGGDFRKYFGDSADFIAYKSDIALPVSLLSFSGTQSGDKIILSWQTESEINSDYFSISISEDGDNFLPIKKVLANGNSTQRIEYSTDYFPEQKIEQVDTKTEVKNKQYYFRLDEYDWDGTCAGAWVCNVRFLSQKTFVVDPINKKIICNNCENPISIYRNSGQLVEKNNLPINISDYQNGIYFAKDNIGQTLRFVVNK